MKTVLLILFFDWGRTHENHRDTIFARKNIWPNAIDFLIDPRNNVCVFFFLLVFTDGVAKVMSVVDTSPPAWYTYYPRPVAGAAHPRDPSSMREKHSSPRKMVAAMPAVVPCVSPKQGSVYPTNHHRHHHHHHYNNNNNNNINVTDNNNRDDGHRHHRQQHHHHHQDRDDSADDNMMPFDLSRNGGSTPSSSPRSPHRSQRMSPAAFKPYDGTGAVINNDQPLDLRVDHKKSRRGDELEDENQNLIIRTPSPEDIEVDSPGPPSLQSYPLPSHHNHNRNMAVHSPCSSDKDVNVTDDQDQQHQHHHQQHHQHQRRAAGITVDDERHHHHRMVNYPVLFPPQQLHPMMLEAMYRAGAGAGAGGGTGGGGDKTRLPTSLAGYQPAAGGGGGFHRPSQHYPFINSPLLNGHHHVPPPTYDVVRPPPPPPVARSPQQKSSAFQETSGKPKDR